MAWKLLRKPLDAQALLLNVLLYALGAGIASYLGADIRWSAYLLGQLAVLSLQVAAYYVQAYFSLETELTELLEEFFKLAKAKRVGEDLVIDRPRYILLLLALPFLALYIVALLLLIQSGQLPGAAFVLLLLLVAAWCAFSLPPLLLGTGGYRDLLQGIALMALVPAISCLLQRGSLVDLPGIFALPLLLAYLALRIVLQLEQYSEDDRRARKTMLTMIGWERGMRLHNLFLLLVYFSLGLSSLLLRLPWELLAPPLISLPFAVLQVVQMIRIHSGAKPNWRLLRFNAFSSFYLLLYLILFTLWVL
ncbi:MAG: hypothetical protein HPY85_08665 [Anaerolineae bacterium]|nr:hypothetical protein [Anaerolineae bacterium]